MCTLIVAFKQHPAVPLLVAANRDEVRSRPARGPFAWPGEPFVAPRDEQAGGTWVGLSRAGLFVGVTNRFPADKQAGRESRGALVVEALRAPSARVLRAQLGCLAPTRFNAFHLLYADAGEAFVTWSDGARVQHASLGPGLHVVTERSLGGDDHGRAALVEAAWPTLERRDGLPTPGALQSLLGLVRPDDPAGSVCVDVPAWNYGTRSALVLVRAEPLSQSRWFWADGRPDVTPFVEQPGLIAALAAD
jgi:hypothetical protein